MQSRLLRSIVMGMAFLAGCGGGGSTPSPTALTSAQAGSNGGGVATTASGTAASASTSGTATSTASDTTLSTTDSQTGSVSSATAGTLATGSLAASVAAPVASSLDIVPKSLRVGLNGILQMSVSASGGAPLSYQWRRNGVALTGETSSSLRRILNASETGASFDVVVSNAGGSAISASVLPQLQWAPVPGQPAPHCHIAQPMAVTGSPVAALSDLDAQVQAYLIARQTPAASMVVRYNGLVVLERGYGWQDLSCTRPTPFDSLFRTASLAKPLTATAVRKAVSEGRFALSDKAFCFTGSPANCVLDLRSQTPADPRMSDITVQHLLEHSAGWDGGTFLDPAFRPLAVAAELGVSSPPGKSDMLRHTVTTAVLDFTPGSRTSYLNFGYLVLGLILEARTGKSYVQYVQDSVLAPLGVTASDARGARSLPAQRQDREPWYSDPRPDEYSSAFDPAISVKYPDGALAQENMDAFGGWVVSGRAYSRFMSAWWLGATPRDGSAGNWNFFGSLPGTFTMAYQKGPVDVVVLSNQRQLDVGGPADEALMSIVDNAVSRITVWPTTPPSGHQP